MATVRERIWIGRDGTERKRWQADFVDQQGRRRHKQFKRKKDADAYLLGAQVQVRDGTYSAESTSPTIAEAAQLWLEHCEAEGLERSSMTVYRSHVVHHIVPLIGQVRLSRLTKAMIEKFKDDLLATRTRRLARAVLKSLKAIINEVMRRGLAAHNPALTVKIKMPDRHERKIVIPTKTEVKALLDAATGRTRALLVVAVFTGMRASEIRGLTWANVDFEAKVIQVRQRADGSGGTGSPKSASSRRDIPMSPMLVNTLKEWRLQSQGELVFPGQAGRPLSHHSLLKQLGRMHRYRHFFASWLIDQGFGPKLVQALMGHNSIAMTFDIYGHLWPQEDDHERFAGELALVGG